VLGVLLCITGAVFVGQGTNAIHGSSMSGHSGYVGLGGVLLLIGVGLLIMAWRVRSSRRA